MTDLRKEIDDFHLIVKENPSILEKIDDLYFLTSFLSVYPDYIDELSDAKMTKLGEFTDPYNNELGDDSGEHLLVSYTNYKNETFMRMHMLGVIAYTRQCLAEYGLKTSDMYVNQKKLEDDKELMEKKEHIKEFLDHVFQYDPSRHIKDCYSEYKDKEMSLKGRKMLFPENVKKEVQEMFDEPRHSAFAELEQDLASFQELGGGSAEEFVQFVKDQKTVDAATGVLSNITAYGLPSADLFSNYDRFHNMYFNEIYGLSHLLWGLSPKINFAMIPLKVSSDEAKLREYEDGIGSKLKTAIASVRMNNWSFLGPWRQNAENIRFQISNKDKETIDVNRMMQAPDHNKLRNQMVLKKTEALKKERPLTEEDKRSLKEYGENMGYQDIINEAINTNSEDLPDDALEYNMLIVDAATGESKTGNLHLKDRVD